MGGISAIGINDDLPSRQSCIPGRSADHKPSGGVDIILCFFSQQLCGNDRLNHMLQHCFPDFTLGDFRRVLCGDHDRIHCHRAVVVIHHGHLGFAIRPQPGQRSVLSDLGQPPGQPVAQCDCHGHPLRRFVAGISEHHALIAGTGLSGFFFPAFQRLINTLCNIRALGMDRCHDRAGIPIEILFAAVITDIQDHLPGNIVEIRPPLGGDLTHQGHNARRCKGFACHPGLGVLCQQGIQHRVADLVAHLVGMSFGHGF